MLTAQIAEARRDRRVRLRVGSLPDGVVADGEQLRVEGKMKQETGNREEMLAEQIVSRWKESVVAMRLSYRGHNEHTTNAAASLTGFAPASFRNLGD